jgi:hypothetical protein
MSSLPDPPAPEDGTVGHRLDRGVILILVGSAVLVISLFLPWYTTWSSACGVTKSVSESAIRAGGWRFDLLGLALATSIGALLGVRLRRLTLALALALPFLTLFWLANSDAVGTSFACPHGGLNLPLLPVVGGGTGWGSYLGLIASFAVSAGAITRALTGSAGAPAADTGAGVGAGSGVDRAAAAGAGPIDRVERTRSRVGTVVLVVGTGLACGLAALVLIALAEPAFFVPRVTSSLANCRSFSSTSPPTTTAPSTPSTTAAGQRPAVGVFSVTSLSCFSDTTNLWVIPAASGAAVAGGLGTFLVVRRRRPGGGTPPASAPAG